MNIVYHARAMNILKTASLEPLPLLGDEPYTSFESTSLRMTSMEPSSRPWLFPGVDRAEAESLLDRRGDGTFLIRGSNTGGYALSIL